MEILGIDLGNSLIRICVLSCGCCSIPLLVVLLINRAVGGRLSVLPVIGTIIPLAAAQVYNVFAALFDRSKNVDADEVAETRIRRTRSNLREKLEAANQRFNAQVSGPTQSAQLRSGQPSNDPLDPRQFQTPRNQPPSPPGNQPRPPAQRPTQRRSGQRPGNIPRQRPGQQQGGDPRFPGGVDPLAGPPPQNPVENTSDVDDPGLKFNRDSSRFGVRSNDQPPNRILRDKRYERNSQQVRQDDDLIKGLRDAEGNVREPDGPVPPSSPPRPPMRTPYERRSDDPWETGDNIRSPRGDDAFGPAGLPGLAGRDFSGDPPPPPRRNPRRDTRKREHNDDEIFGGYFDEDGDGHSDY